MMAAAEARAVWQRAVNRCFVQEDAKRAPKLACCQSSSAASAKHIDSGSSGAVDQLDPPAPNFMPLYQNPQYLNFPPDMRWRVHTKANHFNQNGLNDERANPLEPNLETCGDGFLNTVVKDRNVSEFKDEKCSFGVGGKELRDFECENQQDLDELMDLREKCSFVEMDHVQFIVSKKSNEFCYDPGSHWNAANEKTDPWWRITDKDELASMVAQRSLDYIENCDLPTPKKKHMRNNHPYGSSPFLNPKSQPGYTADGNIHKQRLRHRASYKDGYGQYGSRNSFSYGANQNETTETRIDASLSGVSKAELLEALRHSQTRAREAETAAKEANEEKDHLVKLFLRQASQLFAYKQWFKLLQLETLYHQTKKIQESPVSNLPWMPCEARKGRKRGGKNRKRVRPEGSEPDVTKYAVALALGLSLVGAGLLLGWTVGWMFPF